MDTARMERWLDSLTAKLAASAVIAAVSVTASQRATNLALPAAVGIGIALGVAVMAIWHWWRLHRTRELIGGPVRSQTTRRYLKIQYSSPTRRDDVFRAPFLQPPPPDSPGRLKLNWVTVLDGTDVLHTWVRDQVRPDLYIGVNEVATIMASVFAGQHTGPSAPVVSYLTPPARRNPQDYGQLPATLLNWPNDRPVPKNILIVDSEVKTGDTVNHIITQLAGTNLSQANVWWCSLVLACIQATDHRAACIAANQAPERAIPMTALMTNLLNTSRTTKTPPAHVPHRVAFVSQVETELPNGLR